MATLVDRQSINDVASEIHSNPAWVGTVSGLQAEAIIKGQNRFVYLLRAGEIDSNFYITFIDSDYTIRHQPFKIITTSSGWFCINGQAGGPFLNVPFVEVVHLIMHCQKNECTPLQS